MPIKKKWLLKKVDLYVIQEIFFPFLGGLLFFSFVSIMFQAVRLSDFVIVHGFPLSTILYMCFLMIITFLPVALPVSFLIGVLMGFGRLSSDSELVALKATGFSLNRISAPVFSLSVVVMFFSIFLNSSWVPWCEREFKETLVRVGNTKAVSSLQAGTFTTGFFGLLVFAETADSKKNELTNVFIFDERDSKNPLTVVAQKGRIIPVKADSDYGSSIMLRLYSGNIHQNEIETESYKRTDFDEYDLYLAIEESGGGAALKPKTFSWSQLNDKIKNPPEGTDARLMEEWKAEFWRRITVALSPFTFVLLGIGFGTFRARSVRAGAALITIVIIFIYYTLQLAASHVIHHGYLPAYIAMQIPNLVLLFVGLYVHRKSSW